MIAAVKLFSQLPPVFLCFLTVDLVLIKVYSTCIHTEHLFDSSSFAFSFFQGITPHLLYLKVVLCCMNDQETRAGLRLIPLKTKWLICPI